MTIEWKKTAHLQVLEGEVVEISTTIQSHLIEVDLQWTRVSKLMEIDFRVDGSYALVDSTGSRVRITKELLRVMEAVKRRLKGTGYKLGCCPATPYHWKVYLKLGFKPEDEFLVMQF